MKKYIPHFLFIFLSIIILWGMLLPGYILTLDMPWTPHLSLVWAQDGFNNSYPIRAILYFLTLLIPSWLVQKLMLFALFYLLFYMPWKFLPYIKNQTSRIIAGFIYTLNPFVYSRMLAGQWMHLLAYALLPFFLHTLINFSENPNRKSALKLSLSFFALSLFSVHYLYISLIVSLIWIIAEVIRFRNLKLVSFYCLAILTLLLATSYWTIPALLRSTPLEARFDAGHFEVFASAGNDPLLVMTNVALLGGFWGEDTVWKYYFVWPQASVIFLTSAILIILLVCIGFYNLIQNPNRRRIAFIFLLIGILAYITALGASDTPFKNFNIFLYKHLPLWNGLRDSHKIAGVLALLYSLFASLGLQYLLEKFENKNKQINSFLSISVFILPIVFGMYMWGGFNGQLKPVWYPDDWYKVKEILEKNITEDITEKGNVLVLPWHGYLSLEFANQRVVANPAPNFFGNEKIIASKSVEFGKIYDQEVSAEYRLLDKVIVNSETTEESVIIKEFERFNIKYLLIIKNNGTENTLIHQPKIENSSYFDLTLYESDLITLKSVGNNK